MMNLTLNQELPPYELTAHNYAPDSPNKIHGDEIARAYGFAGGLVPGVGDYAYMTRPIVESLGHDWLERGWMSSKFLKPIYHGDRVRVSSKVASDEPLSIEIEVTNASGVRCAVGKAGLTDRLPPLNPGDYPEHAQPVHDARPRASLAALPVGIPLGSIRWRFDRAEAEAAAIEKFRDDLAIYAGADARCHPALLLQLANDILSENVELGPWIHTASEVQNYSTLREGEELSMRGRVLAAYERRGHEMVELDLGLFGLAERPIARIQHAAIIVLRPAD